MSNNTEISREQLQADLIKAQARIAELESNKHDGALLMSVIDASPIPYALNDEAQNITYLNTAFIATFGYDLDDIPTLSDWWPKAYPDLDYRQSVATTWQINLDRAIQTKTAFEPIELIICCKDGSQRNVIASASSVSDLYIGSHIVILYDITERKKSEEAMLEQSNLLRAIHEASLDLQFILDKDGLVTDYHAHNKNSLYAPPEAFLGRKFSEVLPANVADQLLSAFEEARSSDSLVSFDYVLPMPNGNVNFEAHVVSLKDKRVVVTVRDISKQVQLEEEIFNARRLESIGLLAGGIAHDFNNILMALFGNMELAKTKLPEEHAAYHYIETAAQAFERATQLTQQLLTFSKGGALLIETVNIKGIIRESIEFNLSGSNVKAVLNIPDNLWQGKIDRGQIFQVIGNLTINAKQAMPNGGILTVIAENIKDIKINARPNLSGDYVKISVQDDGIGISDKHIEKIFDPYFTTKQTGNGLGLATVYSIVSKHNGHISIESKIGIGTTCTLYLPADRNLINSADAASGRVIEKSNLILGRVLVMDDDLSIRELLSVMLETCGYTVDSAADGEEALAKYIAASKGNNPFDIVIMDLTIPGGMGGKDTMAELIAIDSQVKAVVSSGYSSDLAMADYEEYGFSGRLAKPFRLADLEKEISRVMSLC